MSAAVTRYWPIAPAVAVAGFNMVGSSGDPNAAVTALGETLLLLPLMYLLVNQIGRRGASWPMLAVTVVALTVIQMQDAVAPSVVLVVIALVVLVWGAIDGTPNGRRVFGVEAAGMLLFGAFALVGLAVDTDLGRYVVAAGWLLHGVWDVAHLRRDLVVARSYALWCAVLDVLVAAQLAFL